MDAAVNDHVPRFCQIQDLELGEKTWFSFGT